MFIVLEGIEGSGKSTQATLLEEYFLSIGREVTKTREPGGEKNIEKLRSLILEEEWSVEAEAALFLATRLEHLEKVIKPALAENKVVICDRYIPSSLAYQGILGNQYDFVYSLNQTLLTPDIYFHFDMSPIDSLNRIFQNNQREINRFDKKSLNYHQKIRNAYSYIFNLTQIKSKSTIFTVDANQSIEDLHQNIIDLYKSKS